MKKEARALHAGQRPTIGIAPLVRAGDEDAHPWDALERLSPNRSRPLVGERCLGAIAEPIERRLEVVSDVVGDLAQTGHELLDPREHSIQMIGEPVELVVRPTARNATREIARHDGLARAGHGVDAFQDVTCQQEATGHAE